MNRLLSNPTESYKQLSLVDSELTSLNYPSFMVNELIPINLRDYSFENVPRFVWVWSKLRLVLDEVYLVHRTSGNIINITNLSKGTPISKVLPKNAQ